MFGFVPKFENCVSCEAGNALSPPLDVGVPPDAVDVEVGPDGTVEATPGWHWE